ncbi:MAG: helix-hairpin-helix domain-containing protein [Acidobacteriota bacterium]|nr:helix-hairpin-helix domain-containing protein [Acidobacteriota bacterium]
MRKKGLWNAVASSVAILALLASPTALSSSKKTPTPAAEASAARNSSSDKVEKVNLNTASEKDIAAAKGVSDKLAKELVKNRPFKTWDDVSKVKGVGTGKKLDALKKVLKLSGGEAASNEMSAKEKKAAKSEKAEKAAEKAEKTPAAASKSSKSAAADEAEKSSTPKLARGEVININRASAAELEKLPEIGPVKSQAIVDYRNANGKFNSIEDIMKVSGIKEGTFAKIKDSIAVR